MCGCVCMWCALALLLRLSMCECLSERRQRRAKHDTRCERACDREAGDGQCGGRWGCSRHSTCGFSLKQRPIRHKGLSVCACTLCCLSVMRDPQRRKTPTESRIVRKRENSIEKINFTNRYASRAIRRHQERVLLRHWLHKNQSEPGRTDIVKRRKNRNVTHGSHRSELEDSASKENTNIQIVSGARVFLGNESKRPLEADKRRRVREVRGQPI